jgi:type IV pilus assembly protein PilA
MSNYEHGFSLIELLIVVAIVGIISAIAIPNLLASRQAANESSAQSSLRTIHSAQSTYQTTHGNGAFSGTLAALRAQMLIDDALGAGDPSTKSGYTFAIVEEGGTGTGAVFGAYGFPTNDSGISQSGIRRFGITEAGVMRGDTTLTDLPNTRALINGMGALGN